ncbi:MAG: preprotein translocase subunit SecA, partial [Microvirga sp.]
TAIEEKVQRGHPFAVVDEVDNILIDEARTPLIISGAPEQAAELYVQFAKLARNMEPGKRPEGLDPRAKKDFVADFDYEFDEKHKTVAVTERGVAKAERFLGVDHLYRAENGHLVNHLLQSLKAESLYKRDVDYAVIDDEVRIIDEFTGRILEGRRWSEGLHQAVEAKEGVRVQEENQTLATITLQNYFRMYDKLSGMTGTALTEATEFMKIYKLGVVQIPTNRPMVRADRNDQVFKTKDGKWQAVVSEIEERHKNGQPVLVGTISVEVSELLGEQLKMRGIPHTVLNAKPEHAEREGEIVAEAGQPGAVTIATNMAGRGVDIKLGGNPEHLTQLELAKLGLRPGDPDYDERFADVLPKIEERVEQNREAVMEAGGLFIVGTERHESRRIDNQLRGRSGRQGDPGRSKFYLSLQDDLMRIFGSDRMDGMLQKLGLEENEAIVHPWINKAIERAQAKVEARNFDIRKNILKYDNVMNDQRKVVFEQRKEFMAEESVRETIDDMRHGVIEDVVSRAIPENAYAEQWDVAGLKENVVNFLNLDLPIEDWAKEEGIADDEIRERITKAADEAYAQRVEANTSEVMNYVEKQVLLQSLDHLWREHLVTLDHLRQVIGWRGLAQRDPLNEYKSEAFELFNALIGHLREQVTGQLMRIQVVFQQPEPQGLPPMFAQHLDPATGENEFDLAQGNALGAASALGFTAAAAEMDPASSRNPNDPSTWGRVSRNEPCPCGSGKKFKHCHGQYVA